MDLARRRAANVDVLSAHDSATTVPAVDAPRRSRRMARGRRWAC